MFGSLENSASIVFSSVFSVNFREECESEVWEQSVSWNELNKFVFLFLPSRAQPPVFVCSALTDLTFLHCHIDGLQQVIGKAHYHREACDQIILG